MKYIALNLLVLICAVAGSAQPYTPSQLADTIFEAIPEGMHINYIRCCIAGSSEESSAQEVYNKYFRDSNCRDSVFHNALPGQLVDDDVLLFITGQGAVNTRLQISQQRMEPELNRGRAPAFDGGFQGEQGYYSITYDQVLWGIIEPFDVQAFLQEKMKQGLITSTGSGVYETAGNNNSNEKIYLMALANGRILFCDHMAALKRMIASARGEVASAAGSEKHTVLVQNLTGSLRYFYLFDWFSGLRALIEEMERDQRISSEEYTSAAEGFESMSSYKLELFRVTDVIEEETIHIASSEESAEAKAKSMKENRLLTLQNNKNPEVAEFYRAALARMPSEVRSNYEKRLNERKVVVDGNRAIGRLVYTRELITSILDARKAMEERSAGDPEQDGVQSKKKREF